MPAPRTYDQAFLDERSPEPRPDAVTVAVSLYHYAHFVEAGLQSVLAQTHRAIELVIVDDHSTQDASLETARAWCQRNAARLDRCTLLRHTANHGLAAARNTAFAQARTDYVFVIDADNLLYPRALERLLAAAREAIARAAESGFAQ